MKIGIFLVSVCLLINSVAQSDTRDSLLRLENTSPPAVSKSRFSYSIALDFISFDQASIGAQGLGDRATALQLSGVYSVNRFVGASIGVGLINLNDSNERSELVVDNDGFVRVIESETRGTSLFGEIYFRNKTSFDRTVYYRAGIGASNITKARRAFDNCDRCEETDFDIEGGGYWLAAIGKRLSRGSGVGLSARYYMTGDLDSSLTLWWQARL